MKDSTKNAPDETTQAKAAHATTVVLEANKTSVTENADASLNKDASLGEEDKGVASVAAQKIEAVNEEKKKLVVDTESAVDKKSAFDEKRAIDEKPSRADSSNSPDSPNSIEWRVAGETVRGASHFRSQLPNQDALLQLRESSISLPIVLSVSDGHGSDKCFRSHRGSHFAVHLAAALLNETLNRSKNIQDVQSFAEEARTHLPAELVKRWRACVDEDLGREPLREEEFARLVEKDGARARVLVEANPYLAYGATLLAVALTSSFALYMQLGDGEILIVSDAGEVTQPLLKDERLLANETTSLCLEKAADDFRFRVQSLGDSPPALILLTTDGYANSFSTTEGFHQVGSDLIQMMSAEGFDSVNRNVKSWLDEATTAGSGDDCTLAFIVRMDAVSAKPSDKNAANAIATSSIANSANTTSITDAANKITVEAAAQDTSADSHEQSAAPKTA